MGISGLAGTTWPWNIRPSFQTDDDVIYAALEDVFFTDVGERKMNTDHGSTIKGILFEGKGDIFKAMATREISLAIATRLPIIKLLRVDVKYAERDTDADDILIEYEFNGIKKTVSIPVK